MRGLKLILNPCQKCGAKLILSARLGNRFWYHCSECQRTGMSRGDNWSAAERWNDDNEKGDV